jgi:TolB-like protein
MAYEGQSVKFSDSFPKVKAVEQISALRVISRTSVMTYKRVRKPLPEIARELNVESVVEGTVSRSGERVRIPSQKNCAASARATACNTL